VEIRFLRLIRRIEAWYFQMINLMFSDLAVPHI